MLSVAVQKDIGEYEQKLFAGLTVRTSASLACGVGAGCLEGLLLVGFAGVGIDAVATLIMGTSMAVFFAGFAKPLGLPLERSLPLYLDAWLGKTKLPCATSICALRAPADRGAGHRRDKASRRRVRAYRKARRGSGARSPELLLPAYAARADEVLGTSLVLDAAEGRQS